ncbi:MAG: DUF2191 domain-containing protein [Candidatus Sumerlaeota bacterium]|nr:DUF2191 domain-containing protein [Candidatus Sumerlaeota bacterium]
MRISVEIDEKTLAAIQRATGKGKKSLAIAAAVESFLREIKKRNIIKRALSGQSDYAMTNEELEARSFHDAN